MQNTSETPASALTMRQLRNLHFFSRCQKALAENPARFTSAHALANHVALSPAPLYYVTFPYAHRVMRRFFLTGSLPGSSPLRVAMWREIMTRVGNRMLLTACPDTDALQHVLAQKASSFFLEPTSAERLYVRIRHLRKRSDKIHQPKKPLL